MRTAFASVFGALTLMMVAVAAPDHAAWPQGARTIRIVLGVPPGGSIDFLARLLADQISTATGQTLIVESKPGAGGIIAAEAVARAAPDGNTLLINNNGTIISAILRKPNYDPIASFEPICYLVTTPQIIVVNSEAPYRTLKDLFDAARKNPGALSIASVGPNTTQHIGIERLKRLAGVNLTYVPYPGGATTINALLGGHITVAVLNWSEIGEHILAGKARALATMAPQRIEPLPDLPTVAESGYPGFRDRRLVRRCGPSEDAKGDRGAVDRLVQSGRGGAPGQGQARGPGALSQSQMRRRFRRPFAAPSRALRPTHPRPRLQGRIGAPLLTTRTAPRRAAPPGAP
jgi:tripartite-type tricarboxylate transporter receptor subunit TctC